MTAPVAPDPAAPPAVPFNGRGRDRSPLPWLAALLTLTLCVVAPLCVGDFLPWDDYETIAKNPANAGPLAAAIAQAWTQFEKGLYAPLTLTAWAILARVAHTAVPGESGSLLNPWVFHTFNVACHLVSTAIAFSILRGLSIRSPLAFPAAAVFAIHPLQIETVGWASGTKDLLCWMFCLAATRVYVRSASPAVSVATSLWRNRLTDLIWVAALMILAALCKPSAVVLPAALFVLDAVRLRPGQVRAILVDLLPFFALAAAIAVVGRQAQYVHHVQAVPLMQRPHVAADALTHYLGKLVWPATLTLDYGRTPHQVLAETVWTKWLLPPAFLAVAFVARRRFPLAWVGALWFVIGIGPVLGLLTFQMQAISTVTDHYVYFSLFGVALVIGSIDQCSPAVRRVLAAGLSVALVALAARAFVRSMDWTDTERLLSKAQSSNPRSMVMATNLAVYYLQSTPQQPELAEHYARIGLSNDPTSPVALAAWINAKAATGQLAAVSHADLTALRVYYSDGRHPRSLRASRLAELVPPLIAAGRVQTARDWAGAALDADPNSVIARQARALAERACASTQPAAGSDELPENAAPATATRPGEN